MSHKILPALFAISTLVLVGAGCGGTADQAAAPSQDKSVWQSIKDAFDRSVSLRCEYSDVDGQKTIAYIKNKAIYLESEPSGVRTKNGEDLVVKGLAKDDKMYIWSANSEKGILLDFKNQKPGSNPAKMGDKEIHSTADIIAKLEEKKDACQGASIPDSNFELPAGIEFIGF